MKLKLAIVALAVSGMLAGTSALARPYYGGGHIEPWRAFLRLALGL
jgi:hypothetical protein